MRRVVHALVICRRPGDPFVATLTAVAHQSRAPESITVVDLSGSAATRDVISETLGDRAVTVVTERPGTGWAQAVNRGRASIAANSDGGASGGWLWVLRDDTTPHSDALRALFVTVDGAPSVVVAGPKQRMADEPLVLREFGETLTRWGERQAVVERELDQAQYDRMSDVLGVGDAGILLDLAVFDDLGGMDPALDPLDAPLDYCVRARLAGHRVVGVPSAVVFVGSGPADWRAGKKLPPATLYQWDRAAWLYRRTVYAPFWAVIPLVLFALPLSFLRFVVFFVLKQPDLGLRDVVATLRSLLLVPQALTARGRLRRSKTQPWSVLTPLQMSPADRRRRRALSQQSKFAEAEEKALLSSRPAFWPSGLWVGLFLLVFGVVSAGPLLDAVALSGGGLLPLSPDLAAVWSEVRWLQPPTVEGAWGSVVTPADPGSLLVALLGSLTWWAPSQAVVWAWALAPLVAFLLAWWSASQLLARSVSTTVFALLWSLAPSLLVALADGRFFAVVTHLALPWLVASALTSHNSWQRAAQAGLATAVVTAASPSLLPAVATGWIAVAILMGWRTPLRTLLGTLPLALGPALVLWLPRWLWLGENPVASPAAALFGDPGVPVAFSAPPWWWNLAGWPVEPASISLLQQWGVDGRILVLLALPLGLLALSVIATSRQQGMGILAVLVPLGLLTAAISPLVEQSLDAGVASGVWPGAGVSLITLGVGLAAAMTLDTLQPKRSLPGVSTALRTALTGGVVLVLVLASVASSLGEATRLWRGDSPVEGLAEARVVPALVAAEAATSPHLRTLVISEVAGTSSFRADVFTGAGPALEKQSVLQRVRPVALTPDESADAAAVASLVRGNDEGVWEHLRARGIRFIAFEGDQLGQAAISLSTRPYLIPAGQTDEALLWQVDDVVVNEPDTVAPSGLERSLSLLFLIVGGLVALLALPTERRPRHRVDDDQDEPLMALGDGEADDD